MKKRKSPELPFKDCLRSSVCYAIHLLFFYIHCYKRSGAIWRAKGTKHGGGTSHLHRVTQICWKQHQSSICWNCVTFILHRNKVVPSFSDPFKPYKKIFTNKRSTTYMVDEPLTNFSSTHSASEGGSPPPGRSLVGYESIHPTKSKNPCQKPS